MGSISGVLNLEDQLLDTLEDEVVKLTLDIYSKLFNINKLELRKIILIDPLNSVISKEYASLIEIIQFNPDIDWTRIFLELERNMNFVPIKIIIAKYFESIDTKKLPYIHYISFLYDSMKSIMEIS